MKNGNIVTSERTGKHGVFVEFDLGGDYWMVFDDATAAVEASVAVVKDAEYEAELLLDNEVDYDAYLANKALLDRLDDVADTVQA